MVCVSARRRSILTLAAVLLVTVALGGCAIFRDIAELNSRIEQAGYTEVGAEHSNVNRLTVTVLLASLVLIAAIVVIVTLLLRRQRQRARQTMSNAPNPGPPPPGWPPPPPPPGYPPPPPPSPMSQPPSDPNP